MPSSKTPLVASTSFEIWAKIWDHETPCRESYTILGVRRGDILRVTQHATPKKLINKNQHRSETSMRLDYVIHLLVGIPVKFSKIQLLTDL